MNRRLMCFIASALFYRGCGGVPLSLEILSNILPDSDSFPRATGLDSDIDDLVFPQPNNVRVPKYFTGVDIDLDSASGQSKSPTTFKAVFDPNDNVVPIAVSDELGRTAAPARRDVDVDVDVDSESSGNAPRLFGRCLPDPDAGW